MEGQKRIEKSKERAKSKRQGNQTTSLLLLSTPLLLVKLIKYSKLIIRADIQHILKRKQKQNPKNAFKSNLIF